MSYKLKYFIIDTLLIASIVALIVFCLVMLSGCAGSGPNGAWTAQDYEAFQRGTTGLVDTYERVRYPDRPIYSPYGPTLYHPGP